MDNCVKYIVCHGSANRFVMIDGVENESTMQRCDLGSLARQLCDVKSPTGGSDGLLMVVRHGDDYAMRMFNTDGSEAEMCGNGIRCAARMINERYVAGREFGVWSGGRRYEISRQGDIGEGLPTYGVEIPVALSGSDFPFIVPEGRFIGKEIAPLGGGVRFTALNLGNPHITACVGQIDMQQLEALGNEVKRQSEWFPKGVNVSLYEVRSEKEIFVATYERGVGITNSCGTAMTASATAAALLGYLRSGVDTDVLNRGGMVRCLPRLNDDGSAITRLTGNATYVGEGTLCIGQGVATHVTEPQYFTAENSAYERFASAILQQRVNK